MSLQKETIEQFMAAVKEEYGRDLNHGEAEEILHGIANYFHILNRIDQRIKGAAEK